MLFAVAKVSRCHYCRHADHLGIVDADPQHGTQLCNRDPRINLHPAEELSPRHRTWHRRRGVPRPVRPHLRDGECHGKS